MEQTGERGRFLKPCNHGERREEQSHFRPGGRRGRPDRRTGRGRPGKRESRRVALPRSSGLGLIITSTKEMGCTYTSLGGFTERYYGTIRKFGLDIGQTNCGVLAWNVLAPTSGPRRGALVGDYVGADASATVGVGVGANLLVGGFDRSITLQPLSVQAQTGLSLAAGVASLTLRQGN